MSTYSVRSGDTLSSIASRYKTTVAKLVQANKISNPNLIKIGQKLTIPDSFSPSVSVPGQDLKRGSSGSAVKSLQDALVKLGYMSAADQQTGPGVFGPRTENAVKKFQAANGVESTGYYGPKTRAALQKALSNAGTSNNSSNSTTGTNGTNQATGVDSTGSKNGAGVTMAQLRAIMPNLSAEKAQKYLPYLNAAMSEAGINTPKRQAAFLAQIAHESGELRYMEEIASGSAYEGRRDLGNVNSGDGVRYKGRGPIQLTGRSNYRAAGNALGIDLENNPTRAADPDVAFRTAAWYWNSRNLNSYADSGDFDTITRRVNGGLNGKSSRDAYYNKALNVLC